MDYHNARLRGIADAVAEISPLSAMVALEAADEIDRLEAENERLRRAMGTAKQAMDRCEHDGGFDREIGPIGCMLGDKCVCIGVYPILADALEAKP